MATGAEIAQAAQTGVGANWATNALGHCAQFMREVLQHTGVNGNLFGGNAIESAKKFRAAHKMTGNAASLKPGDVLFQEFGSWIDMDGDGKKETEAGHTAIYLGNNRIAENGFSGKRIASLASFGRITGVGQVASDATTAAPDPYTAAASGGTQHFSFGELPINQPRQYTLASGTGGTEGAAPELNKGGLSSNPLDWLNSAKPYAASVGVGLAGLLLLLLGAWAVIGSGGSTVQVEVQTESKGEE